MFPQDEIETVKTGIFDVLKDVDVDNREKAIIVTAIAVKAIISQDTSPLNKLDRINQELSNLKNKFGIGETKKYKSLFLEEFQKDNTSKNLAIRTKKL